VTGWWSSNMT